MQMLWYQNLRNEFQKGIKKIRNKNRIKKKVKPHPAMKDALVSELGTLGPSYKYRSTGVNKNNILICF